MSDRTSSKWKKRCPEEQKYKKSHNFSVTSRSVYWKKYRNVKNPFANSQERVLSKLPCLMTRSCSRFEVSNISKPKEIMNVRKRNFTPAFLKNNKNIRSQVPLLKKSKSEDRINNNVKTGPLLLKYREICREIEENQIRFVSGSYPYGSMDNSRVRRDPSDPRSRIGMYMDVTILKE